LQQSPKLIALKKHKEIFRLPDLSIPLWVPDQIVLQQAYQEAIPKAPFPYWAKLWPAAHVLAVFIYEHPDLLKNKRVLELGAGLGLPSLLAAKFASSVICSDLDEEAVRFIEMNITLNNLTNMVAKKMDWGHLPADLDADVLLMSDINYDQKDFQTLLELFQQYLAMGKMLLLSTPQRIAGKAFISQLLPYCILNEERWHEQTPINVLVLRK
jgi:predicted nicotinamide N-methyase